MRGFYLAILGKETKFPNFRCKIKEKNRFNRVEQRYKCKFVNAIIQEVDKNIQTQ